MKVTFTVFVCVVWYTRRCNGCHGDWCARSISCYIYSRYTASFTLLCYLHACKQPHCMHASL